jgi:hypothetical protein
MREEGQESAGIITASGGYGMRCSEVEAITRCRVRAKGGHGCVLGDERLNDRLLAKMKQWASEGPRI